MTDLERATQLWCLPQFSKMEMDVEFAKAIAQTFSEIRAEAMEEAAKIAENCNAVVCGTYSKSAQEFIGNAIAWAIRSAAKGKK